MRKCQFDKAWIGPCNKQILNEEDEYCDEHKDLKCTSCGKPATRECDETFQLVCGFPLCNDCGHYDKENKYKHCEKPMENENKIH